MNMIGYTVILKRGMLGNEAGALGYVFNQYEDFDDPSKLGVQVIFQNGNYDGFSTKEQDSYLTILGQNRAYSEYEFKNVMQVSKDYLDGYWKFV